MALRSARVSLLISRPCGGRSHHPASYSLIASCPNVTKSVMLPKIRCLFMERFQTDKWQARLSRLSCQLPETPKGVLRRTDTGSSRIVKLPLSCSDHEAKKRGTLPVHSCNRVAVQ
ncbi:hypothetical protein IG631_15330 [Alternaria alternata]|nr:hypothetical protein IG631_15330 [Alternaria alternata]